MAQLVEQLTHTLYLTLAILAFLFLNSCEDKSVVDEKEQTTPVVSIISPLTGDIYFTTDTISIEVSTADDKGVAKVEIYINGKTDSSKTLFVPPFICKWLPPSTLDSTTYSIFAKSYDTDNNVASSKIIYVQVQSLAAPSSLTLDSLTQSTVGLSWRDNSFNEDGFEVYRSNNAVSYFLIKTLSKNITSTIISGDNSIKYYYKVRAVSAGKYSSFSNTISVNQFNDPFIPSSIFPLTAGHRFDYTGYFTIADTETPVAGSSTFYNSSWTLGGNTPFAAIFGATYGGLVTAINGGKTGGILIYDTTLTAPGGSKKFTPIFAYYDSASKDYYYMINLGLFFRSAVIKDSATAAGNRKDSLRYVKLASPRAGVGGEFMVFQQSYVSYSNPAAPTTLHFTLTGRWESKINVTVNAVTYNTYYLVISRNIKVGTATISAGIMAKYWFAPDIGPVKMFVVGDAESNGNYRELKSKNF